MSPVTFRPAKREGLPLVLGVAGGTGSGKTMSALRLAKGLAGDKRFCVLDSEARRALHYSDAFEFDHAVIEPPFRPARYLEAIKAAEAAGYPVIVVDSMSHLWSGPGGVLEWHDELMGGSEAKKMVAWVKPKTEHRKLVQEMLQLKAHLVLAFRAQMKVEMLRVDGKWEVVPKKSLAGLDGWIPICEKELPFELTMSLLLTADAPGVPRPIKLEQQHRPFLPLDSPITEETGAALARWAAGTPEKPTKVEAEVAAAEAEISGRVSELLVFADEGAKREAVLSAIARNRRGHSGDLGAHLAWLNAQLEKARAKAAEVQPDEDLPL